MYARCRGFTQLCLSRCTRLFFFSSRRRHTRLVSDWSSDVCSSDLERSRDSVSYEAESRDRSCPAAGQPGAIDRSEERRVGKEGRSRWWTNESKQKGRVGSEQERRRKWRQQK